VADFGCIQGMAQAGRNIFVASTITSSRQWRWVVAHELGHILVQRGQLPHCHESEEWTADWFARELLAPTAELATLGQLSDEAAAAHFDVAVMHILLQRMRIAGVHEAMVHEHRVLCPDCGHAISLPWCACSGLRERLREARDTDVSRAALQPGFALD
jgi:hypothetical protein